MRLRPLVSVDTLFVLASMTRPDQVTSGEQLEYIHRNQGYSRIAVHYVIERDGTIYEGRPRNLPGVMAGKRNSSAYQVCLLGGVDDAMRPADNFTRQQWKSLKKLARELGLPVMYARDFPATSKE